MAPVPLLRSITLLTLVLALPALGQGPTRTGIGLKAGVLQSIMHVEGVPHDPAIGALAGTYIPIWVGNRFEIQPELLVSLRASTFAVMESGHATFRSYQVELPLCAKLYVSNVVNFQFGGQVSKLLKAGITLDGSSQDVTAEQRSFEAGTVIGLGADMNRGLDLGLRYYYGMTSLTDDTSLNPTYRTLQFSIGYRFWRWKSTYVRKRV
jgi:hypothetical protein